MNIVKSKNEIPIRLTEERWFHIIEEHNELAGYYYEVLETIANPQVIYKGKSGECIALRPIGENKFISAIYRESERDGFVITAFITSKLKQFQRRIKLWP